jgi:hypothetical protein
MDCLHHAVSLQETVAPLQNAPAGGRRGIVETILDRPPPQDLPWH